MDNTSKTTRYTAAKSKNAEVFKHTSEDNTCDAEFLDYWGTAPFQPLCSLNRSGEERYSGGGSRRVRSTSAPPQSVDYDCRAGRNDSQYHERCVAQKPAVGRSFSPRAPMTTAELRKADIVSQDKIWKEAVSAETGATGRWQNTWGFLLDYDSKGRPVERKEVQSGENCCVPVVPRTNAGNYGARQNTEVGQTMLKMESQLSSKTRKKKLGSEMICY